MLRFLIYSLMASSVLSVRFTESADGQLNRNYDDGDALSIDDSVLILTGKYKGCEGVVEKASSSKNKVKVRRQCGDGRRGDGKAWWYKPGQVEELIEDEVEEGPAEEDLSEDQDISPVMNAEFLRNHPLCDRYKDLPAIDPRAKPPVLGGRPVVRRGQRIIFKANGAVATSMTSADFGVLGEGSKTSARIQGLQPFHLFQLSRAFGRARGVRCR